MKSFHLQLFLLLLLIFYSCKRGNDQSTFEDIPFEILVRQINMGDRTAEVFIMKNGNGMEVEVLNYGGILSRIAVPDKNGNFENVLLTYESPEQFFTDRYFFGATAGRYANRIAKGRLEIDGTSYQLTQNSGENHIHGGREGFNRKFWKAEVLDLDNSMGVQMTYLSEDGEEGYPGNLKTTLKFILDHENRLSISMEAETDQPTVVNLTHHGYFNLSGMKEDILGHQLQLFADHYTPVGEGLIPTGEIAEVSGTPFDFRTPRIVGDRIEEVGPGYDHNFVVKMEHDGKLAKMAELTHFDTGRKMILYSSKPGVQFYTGNFLDGMQTTSAATYTKHFGLCLEPQFFPDSPNQPRFPSPRLDPGQVYKHDIVYEFQVIDG
jgi:aldose 1-epimerase